MVQLLLRPCATASFAFPGRNYRTRMNTEAHGSEPDSASAGGIIIPGVMFGCHCRQVEPASLVSRGPWTVRRMDPSLDHNYPQGGIPRLFAGGTELIRRSLRIGNIRGRSEAIRRGAMAIVCYGPNTPTFACCRDWRLRSGRSI